MTLGERTAYAGPVSAIEGIERRLKARLWGDPVRPGDVMIALGAAAIQIAGTYFAARHQPTRRSLDALAFFLLAVGPAGLLIRRRYPVVVLAVAFASTHAYSVIGYGRGPIFASLIVAFFTAIMRGHRFAAMVSLPLGYVSFLWLGWALGRERAPTLAAALGLAAWLLVLFSAAEIRRVRRDRALEAQRTREEEAKRRAGEERMRIARELHDVLAHNISLINVQAGVALHLIDERPEQARTALAAIKQASKDALREMRSVIDVLRQVDDEEPRTPTAGLSELDDLVARAAQAGLPVRTEVEGNARPVPPEVDLAALRIVQEALTNVRRHAGSATAMVLVAYGDRDLTVQVDDDGPGGTNATASGGGKGLIGMRERVAALGGEIEAGPRPGGGFRVRARLPLDGEA